MSQNSPQQVAVAEQKMNLLAANYPEVYKTMTAAVGNLVASAFSTTLEIQRLQATMASAAKYNASFPTEIENRMEKEAERQAKTLAELEQKTQKKSPTPTFTPV